MARFNEILVGRYNRALQKLLSMKGGASLVTLSDELMPVLALSNGAENRYLESWDRFGLEMAQTAVAANQSGFRLRNPVGSNVLAIFEKIDLIVNTSHSPSIHRGQATADLSTASAVTGIRIDSRGRPSPALVLSQQASAVSVPALTNDSVLAAVFMPATSFYQYMQNENQEIPLLPGDAMQIVSDVVNHDLFCNLLWRERFLEDSERA